MQRKILSVLAVLIIGGFTGRALAVPGDVNSRTMGLGQAYTALARGPESAFWNPANLALSGSSDVHWDLFRVGISLVAENNSFAWTTYMDNFTENNKNVSPNGTQYYISPEDKVDLLDDIPAEGLKINVDIDPSVAVGIPINGGVAFSIGKIRSAVSIGFNAGIETEISKDMFDLFLSGNEFDRNYAISDWDGSGWALGTINFSAARSFMPMQLKPYLSEFTAGGTFKISLGSYGEVMESGGTGLSSGLSGFALDSYLVTRSAGFSGSLNKPKPGLGGLGFGLDFGVAAVTKDRKATISLGFLNLLDTFSWSMDARQDSLFIGASDLRITKFVDEDSREIADVLDNEDLDGDGTTDFYKQISDEGFSRSLPAMMRFGVSYQVMPKLMVVGNYDQAFSNGFGVSSTPRLAGGAEYRLVDWFPTRIGLSLGGRSNGASVGFAFGPFLMPNMSFTLLDFALFTRGGFVPGVAKGTALSLQFVRIDFI